jgi:hypothetical protein
VRGRERKRERERERKREGERERVASCEIISCRLHSIEIVE